MTTKRSQTLLRRAWCSDTYQYPHRAHHPSMAPVGVFARGRRKKLLYAMENWVIMLRASRQGISPDALSLSKKF
jgi:hypothetical protein